MRSFVFFAACLLLLSAAAVACDGGRDTVSLPDQLMSVAPTSEASNSLGEFTATPTPDDLGSYDWLTPEMSGEPDPFCEDWLQQFMTCDEIEIVDVDGGLVTLLNQTTGREYQAWDATSWDSSEGMVLFIMGETEESLDQLQVAQVGYRGKVIIPVCLSVGDGSHRTAIAVGSPSLLILSVLCSCGEEPNAGLEPTATPLTY